MKINKYPDGSSYVSISEPTNPMTFRVNSYEDLWHLNQLIDAYNNQTGSTPTVVIPNLIDAQADRRFSKDQSSGLKLVCQFLNTMNATFEIFHPHNPDVVEAMMNNVKIIDNSDFIINVFTKIDSKNPILMSSDAGGFKPLMKLCDKLNWRGDTFSASKARTKSGMKQIVDRENFEGRDILIIDDISVYGGTFKGLSNILRSRNCGKLYLAVSHMTIENLGKDSVTHYFDHVFTTNSKFDFYGYPNKDNTGLISPKNLTIINFFN